MRYFERTVREYMSSPVHCVAETDPLPEVYRALEQYRVSGLPVVSPQSRVVGVVSRSDLLEVGVVRTSARWQRPVFDFPDQPASHVMTRNPLCIDASALVSDAVEGLLRERVHRVCALENEEVIGVFTTHDALRAVVDERIPAPLGEFATASVVTSRAADPVERALERLSTAHVRALIVTDGDLPIGVFGELEALLAKRSPTPTRVEDWADPRVLYLPANYPVHRAAAQMVALGADHVVVFDTQRIAGLVTASDLVRSGLSAELQEGLRPRDRFR